MWMINVNLPIGNVEEEELNCIWFTTPCPRLGLRMSTSCSKEANSCCLHRKHLAHVLLGGRKMLSRCLLNRRPWKIIWLFTIASNLIHRFFGPQLSNCTSVWFWKFTLNMSGGFPSITIICFFLIFLIFQHFVFLLILIKQLYSKF